VVPVQDVLGLGAEARMNTPSVAAGNWAWRMTPEQMDAGLYAELARLTRLFGR
jgi:4-alpha-glucanotransferase